MNTLDYSNLESSLYNIIRSAAKQTGESRFYVASLAGMILQDMQREIRLEGLKSESSAKEQSNG
jgi:hypothetical protein